MRRLSCASAHPRNVRAMSDVPDDICGNTEEPQTSADSVRYPSMQKEPANGQRVSSSRKPETSTSPSSPPSSPPDESSGLTDALLKRDREEVKRLLRAGVSPNSVKWKAKLPILVSIATVAVSFSKRFVIILSCLIHYTIELPCFCNCCFDIIL